MSYYTTTDYKNPTLQEYLDALPKSNTIKKVKEKNPKKNFVSFFLGSRVKQINSYDNNLNSVFSGVFCNFKNNK